MCEDPTYDRYIIEPVVAKVAELLGRPRVQVKTVDFPRVYGVTQLKASVCAFVRKWGPISSAVLFVVDADGEDGAGGRPSRAAQFENAIADCASPHCYVVVVAVQELEVWALWGCYQTMDVTWAEIRAETHPKERFFEHQLIDTDLKSADRGRRRLIEASLAKGWASFEGACPELGGLRDGLCACL